MTTFSDFRDEVRERADLLAVVEQTVTIKQRSARIPKVACPFHNDSGPSLALYPSQGRWHCYGACNEGGDVFTWIQQAGRPGPLRGGGQAGERAGDEVVPSFNNDRRNSRRIRTRGRGCSSWRWTGITQPGRGRRQGTARISGGARVQYGGVVAVAVGRSAGRECAAGVFQARWTRTWTWRSGWG
jgi:hypothetical protein